MNESSAPAEPPKNLTKLRVVMVIADVIAIVFWLYAILSVFVIDIDSWARGSTIPGLDFLVTYKFFFFAGALAALFLLVRNIWSLPLLGYIILFPLIVCFWKIPRWVWKAKSALVTLAFLNSVISFFMSIRYVVAAGGAFVALSGVLLLSTNYVVNVSSIILLSLVLAVVYVNKIRAALQPSPIYQVHSKIVSWFGEHFRDAYKSPIKTSDDPPKIEALEAAAKSEWVQNVQILVVANRGAYFLSDKLRKYQASNAKVVFYLLHLLFLVAISVFAFAVMNFGLWRAAISEFQVSDGRLFVFVYYSLSSMFGRGIPEILPIGDLARVLSILQIVCSFVLIGIIVVLIFSFQSNSDDEQLGTAIGSIETEGETLDQFIQSEFRMTSDEAIVELEKAKSAFIRVIYYLTVRE